MAELLLDTHQGNFNVVFYKERRDSIMATKLWSIDDEKLFFTEALENFLTEQQLFYSLQGEYYAYVPKSMPAQNQTLQSRNGFIGKYTEKWCQKLLSPVARKLGLYAVNEVVCEELALPNNSAADLAFCTTDSKLQQAQNIKLIFEVKMSIVNNYRYSSDSGISFIGNYKSHRGKPALLRSDSMLKAIGKSLNIRVSSKIGNGIPIVILGNSPITHSYKAKVDLLKESGVIQGFWSLYPDPCDDEQVICTEKRGFQTLSSEKDLYKLCQDMINNDLRYFSSMLPKAKIGEIIQIASKEPTNELKADKFLQLISE